MRHFVSVILLSFLYLLFSGSIPVVPDHCSAEPTKVFVVMSTSAYAYHRTKACSAVKKATHKVKEVTLAEAREMGRKPCKMCYN